MHLRYSRNQHSQCSIIRQSLISRYDFHSFSFLCLVRSLPRLFLVSSSLLCALAHPEERW